MKYRILLLLVICCNLSFAQSILQLRTYPANPTSSDTIYVLADLQFAYSGCALDNKNHQINGNSIYGYTLHCMGIAAAICNKTDSFKLGVLQAGTYSFDLTLAHGGGAVPCSPGFVPSDMDTMSFTVQSPLGIPEKSLASFKIFPNPAKDVIEFSDAYQQLITSFKVLSITGAVVFESDEPVKTIDISKFPPGVYMMELYHETGMISEKFIKE